MRLRSRQGRLLGRGLIQILSRIKWSPYLVRITRIDLLRILMIFQAVEARTSSLVISWIIMQVIEKTKTRARFRRCCKSRSWREWPRRRPKKVSSWASLSPKPINWCRNWRSRMLYQRKLIKMLWVRASKLNLMRQSTILWQRMWSWRSMRESPARLQRTVTLRNLSSKVCSIWHSQIRRRHTLKSQWKWVNLRAWHLRCILNLINKPGISRSSSKVRTREKRVLMASRHRLDWMPWDTGTPANLRMICRSQ